MPEFEWDDDKRTLKLAKHGVNFDLARLFYWDVAIVETDQRSDYGELRFSAKGPINGRLHVMIYVIRSDSVRIISLRKANRRERRNYERAMANRASQ